MLQLDERAALERIGSDYGGWVVPVDLLGADSIAYCAGVGEDVTFDLALIERLGCEVWAMDPTEAAARHVSGIEMPARFHFLPVGVWSEDTTLRFFAPADDEHASWSALNLQHTDRSVEAPVRSLRSLMDELGHDRIDLLKLDVEGAEYPVIHQMLDEEIPVRVLCFELHPTRAPWAPPRLIARLQRGGYRAVDRTELNFTFIGPA